MFIGLDEKMLVKPDPQVKVVIITGLMDGFFIFSSKNKNR